MNTTLQYLFRRILLGGEGSDALGGIDFSGLPDSKTGAALRAFAAAVSGDDTDHGASRPETAFLHRAVALITEELDRLYREDSSFRESLEAARRALETQDPLSWNDTVREAVWRVFFPEGAQLLNDQDREIASLRRRRTVEITALNESPLTDPAREILFTSNVLITTPADATSLDKLDHTEDLTSRIRATMEEVQLYYYDHPIHIGVATDHNEAIYGMRGLDHAIAWEKTRGRIPADTVASVVLSLSVTHEGLHTVAREYLLEEFARGGPFPNLQIYLFTELECRAIIQKVLAQHLPESEISRVEEVFGVDGEYGRHYSFLKAIAALWSSLVDPAIRATFKIDLDQVFPQDELLAESGESALEHFTTPLWGARGKDSDGKPVRLGMIAGALVNEKDIGRGLFTPDVPFPEAIPAGEAVFFFNKLPMALSTEAEMMTRYDETTGIDGENRCLLRYHVTGGTNGILVEDLRRYRPFTPTFVGRAEDQAYILSVLYDGKPALRYLHKPGLIMRHDKEAFAGESIRAAKHGRFIGDLVRTLVYSRYVEALPWDLESTKGQIDPFTGCFVTRRPMTIVFMRLALYCAEMLENDPRSDGDVARVLDLANRKLSPLIDHPDSIGRDYRRQRNGWDLFYDALEKAERSENSGSAAREIVAAARIA